MTRKKGSKLAKDENDDLSTGTTTLLPQVRNELEDKINSRFLEDKINSSINHSFLSNARKYQLIHSGGTTSFEQLTFEAQLLSFHIFDIMLSQGWNDYNEKIQHFFRILDRLFRIKNLGKIKTVLNYLQKNIIVSVGSLYYALGMDISKSSLRRYLNLLVDLKVLQTYPLNPILEQIDGSLVPLTTMKIYGYPGLGDKAYEELIVFLKEQTKKARIRQDHEIKVKVEKSLRTKVEKSKQIRKQPKR